MFGLSLNGLYELSLLKTTTVVGTGEVKFILGRIIVKTLRNCSSRLATCLISFSLALPTRKKFVERMLVQLSLAFAVVWPASRMRNSPVRAAVKRVPVLRET